MAIWGVVLNNLILLLDDILEHFKSALQGCKTQVIRNFLVSGAMESEKLNGFPMHLGTRLWNVIENKIESLVLSLLQYLETCIKRKWL